MNLEQALYILRKWPIFIAEPKDYWQ